MTTAVVAKSGLAAAAVQEQDQAVFGMNRLQTDWLEGLEAVAEQFAFGSSLQLATERCRELADAGLLVTLRPAADCATDQKLREFFLCLGADADCYRRYWQLPLAILSIQLKEGRKLTQPLYLSELVTGVSGVAAQLFHLDLELGAGAKLTIVDDLYGQLASSQFGHVFRSFRLGKQAQLAYVLPEFGDEQVTDRLYYQRTHSIAQAGAQLNFLQAQFAGVNGASVVESIIAGRQVESQLNLALLTGQTQRSTFHYRQRHLLGDNQGQIQMRAVARANSVTVLPGVVEISQDAQAVDSSLDQQILNLGDKAVVKPIPQLEIAANEVQAAHRAMVSQINQADYFYAAGRGLAPKEAERLVVKGFLNELIKLAPPTVYPEQILSKLDAYL